MSVHVCRPKLFKNLCQSTLAPRDFPPITTWRWKEARIAAGRTESSRQVKRWLSLRIISVASAGPHANYLHLATGLELRNSWRYPNHHRFAAMIQVNLCKPNAPPVNNWRILLVQSFAARMPLLTATSTFGLGRRRWSSPQQCYLHCLCALKSK